MAFESNVSLRKRKKTKMELDDGSDNDSDASEDSAVGSTSVSETVSR